MKTNGKKICFLGDSITEGCGASAPEKNFVSLFAAAHPKTAVHNCGVGGTRIAPQKTPFSPACAHPFYSRRFGNAGTGGSRLRIRRHERLRRGRRAAGKDRR